MATTPTRMPRKDMSLSEKINLLDMMKSQPARISHRKLAEKLQISKSTITRLLRHQHKLREEWKLQSGSKASHKRKRESKYPDIDKALGQWFEIYSKRGENIGGPMLRKKAEQLAKKLGYANFKASDGWLSRWKCRHNVKYKRLHKKKNIPAPITIEFWKLKTLPELLKRFSADDIYNADETGLYYRATPDGSLNYQSAALSTSEESADHITILCCSNMSGSDKLKLLIVGKKANPICFKGFVKESLPVSYYSNNKALMTTYIFTQWLLDWDADLQKKSRKILLVLDECIAHPNVVDGLKNIQLEFLPQKNTSLLQPMEVGVVQHLKTYYRGMIINHILELIEENQLTSYSTAIEVGSKISLLQAIQFVADSWRGITSKTIQKCFDKCGFSNNHCFVDPRISEVEIILELQQVQNCVEFLSIDDQLQCHDESEDLDDTIIEKIAENQPKIKEELCEDSIMIPDEVTNYEARKCIEKLRYYFMQPGNELSPLSELDNCADFVHLQSIKGRFCQPKNPLNF